MSESDESTVWRWATFFLAGVVVSMLAFWLTEAREYVTEDDVVQTVEQVVGREEIMSTLSRIEGTTADVRQRVRALESTSTRLETLMDREP